MGCWKAESLATGASFNLDYSSGWRNHLGGIAEFLLLISFVEYCMCRFQHTCFQWERRPLCALFTKIAASPPSSVFFGRVAELVRRGGQMAPGWVRISQLHMKEERQRVGKWSAGMKVFFFFFFLLWMMKRWEPSCFDHSSSVLIDVPDEQPYAQWVPEAVIDFGTVLYFDWQMKDELCPHLLSASSMFLVWIFKLSIHPLTVSWVKLTIDYLLWSVKVSWETLFHDEKCVKNALFNPEIILRVECDQYFHDRTVKKQKTNSKCLFYFSV